LRKAVRTNRDESALTFDFSTFSEKFHQKIADECGQEPLTEQQQKKAMQQNAASPCEIEMEET
jgi:hypothetical protein